MRGAQVAHRLPAAAEGLAALDPAARRHVERCLRCQADAVQYRRILRAMRALRTEVLVPTPGLRNLIREDKIHQIYSAMQAGQEKLGMQTMNQSLVTLHQRRLISTETAMNASSMRDELTEMMNRGVGVVAGAGMGRTTPGMRPPLTR